MPSWPGRNKPPPVTDRERIEAFFEEVGEGRLFGTPNLNDLFGLARRIRSENGKLSSVNDRLGQANERLTSENHDLKARLNSANAGIQDAQVKNKTLKQKNAALQAELDASSQRWGDQLNVERATHQSLMEDKDAQHLEKLEKEASEKQLQKAKYEHKINELKSDIMVNQKDSKSWTDEKLKNRLQDLRMVIQGVAPNWTEVPDPERHGGGVPESLDPTGFVARAGNAEYPFLIRGVIWGVLLEHFFSAPFGFGALGEQGRSLLFKAYKAWRSLFDDGPEDEVQQSFTAVFTTDEDANSWRSATFESIYSSLVNEAKAGGGGASHRRQDYDTPLRAIYDSNVQGAVQRIVAIMGEARPEQPLSTKEMTQVDKAVTMAAQLGLQFGVHMGVLRLTCPRAGQTVTIGKEFNDHRDGAIHRGKSIRVDIVAEPGLSRLGDGSGGSRADEMVQLLPCVVVPLNS